MKTGEDTKLVEAVLAKHAKTPAMCGEMGPLLRLHEKETSSERVHRYRRLTTNLVLWLVLWTALTVQGIWAKAQEADLPSFRSLHTDLLNPWATWCHESNGAITGCFGTS